MTGKLTAQELRDEIEEMESDASVCRAQARTSTKRVAARWTASAEEIQAKANEYRRRLETGDHA